MLSKLVEEFLKEYLARRPYLLDKRESNERGTTKEELIKVLTDMEKLIRDNKDKTPEEIIDLIIQDTIEEYEKVREKYMVPGYTFSSQVGNINAAVFGGKLSTNGSAMTEDALFDIASMTKFYTQIIIYNLINKGYLKRSDKIADLDKSFPYLGDVTVDDILTFGVAFTTPRIDKQENSIDAMKAMHEARVVQIGKYDYNDIGMMIMKEVAETLTGKTFAELFDIYIISPLKLKNTHLIVPKEKYSLITGSLNANVGLPSDIKACLSKDGYSGHAGAFASYSDIMTMMRAAKGGIILPNSEDTYTPGNLETAKGVLKDNMARMGNVYVAHPKGIDKTWVTGIDPKDMSTVSGSTKTNAAATYDSAYTVMFNQGSSSDEVLIERLRQINEAKIKNGETPLSTDIHVSKKIKGKNIDLRMVDMRELLPFESLEDPTIKTSELTLKLRFLDFVTRKYERDYETNYKKRVA